MKRPRATCTIAVVVCCANQGVTALAPSATPNGSHKTLWPRLSTTYRYDSRRYVSELHVPGYAQSKLSFLWNDEGTNDVLTPLQYNDKDSDSLVPFQDGHLLHCTTQPILTSAECQNIVDEAEQVASVTEWTKNRHGHFPTTDLPLVELPRTLRFLQQALVERIYPVLAAQFGTFLPDASKIRVADGFVVKYDAAGGQTELKPHRDGSVVSFNIALNDGATYQGGGTWFATLDRAVRVEQGHMLSHASGLLHGGHGITTGTRYILVAFCILEGYDSWSMRFYNQVRNL